MLTNSAGSATREIDIAVFFNILKRKKLTILGCALLSLCAAGIYLFLTVPLYKADTTVFVDTRQENVLDGSSVLTELTGDSAVIAGQVEIIRSRHLADKVARRYHLYGDPEFIGGDAASVKEKTVFGNRRRTSLKKAEETVSGRLKTFSKAETPAVPPDPKTRSLVLDRFAESLYVRRFGLTQAIEISFVSRDPEKAKILADAVAHEYLNEQLEAKLDATERATAWLDEKLDYLRADLKAKEDAIIRFKQENNLFSAGGSTQTEQQVARLNEQLILAKVETAEKRAKYRQVSELAKTGRAHSFSGALASDVISLLRDQETEITREISDLSQRYGEAHPKLKNARAQFAGVTAQINAEVRRIVAGAKSEYRIAESRERSLAENLDHLKQSFDQTGRSAVRLRQLEREAEAARDSFNVIADRFRQTDRSEKVQQSDARVISKAEVPLTPYAPNKNVVLLLALAFGLVSGVLLACVREFLITGFMTAEAVEKETGFPVIVSLEDMPLAVLQKTSYEASLFKYILKKPFSSIAEAVRKIRVAIDAPDAQVIFPKIVMFVSSLPDEGKTSLTLACAASAANAGAKVLVIDADFRNPNVTENLTGRGVVSQGLGELLSGQCDLEAVINYEVIENVDFIGVSAVPKSPSDILKNGVLDKALERLKERYDLILIDTPPLHLVADGPVIAESVEKIVFVTLWEKTPRSVVVGAIKALERNTHKIVGIALNRVNLRKESSYGSYHTYNAKKYSKNYYQN